MVVPSGFVENIPKPACVSMCVCLCVCVCSRHTFTKNTHLGVNKTSKESKIEGARARKRHKDTNGEIDRAIRDLCLAAGESTKHKAGRGAEADKLLSP